MKTLLVCVGCGGVFYHGIPRLAVWCQRREDVEIVLIDPDKIEDRNKTRQWGSRPGLEREHKADVAQSILMELGLPDVITRRQPYSYSGLQDTTTLVLSDKSRIPNGTYGRIVVIAAPDNHMCRLQVHEGCKALALETELPVYDITAGNDMEGGYAYGCIWQGSPPGPDGIVKDMCDGDWAVRRYDIVDGAKAEEAQLENPMPCGSMQEERVGQTMMTNQLTALCIWDLAEMMIAEDKVGEVCWRNVLEENGTTRYTKVWAKLQDRKSITKG